MAGKLEMKIWLSNGVRLTAPADRITKSNGFCDTARFPATVPEGVRLTRTEIFEGDQLIAMRIMPKEFPVFPAGCELVLRWWLVVV